MSDDTAKAIAREFLQLLGVIHSDNFPGFKEHFGFQWNNDNQPRAMISHERVVSKFREILEKFNIKVDE